MGDIGERGSQGLASRQKGKKGELSWTRARTRARKKEKEREREREREDEKTRKKNTPTR